MEVERVVNAADTLPVWYPVTGRVKAAHGKTRLNIRGFQHSLPQTAVDYYSTRAPIDKYWSLTEEYPRAIEPVMNEPKTVPVLCIGMAFYNEDPLELRRTLVSLSDQVKEMQAICDTRVVIVSDGHAQMHKETKKYLRSLFCNKKTEEDQFDELFASLDRYVKDKADADEDERIGTPIQQRKLPPPPLTYVIQRVNNEDNNTISSVRIKGAKDGNEERFLEITLILKSLNRRKHNSQEWMFNFAQRSDYIFLTDCGTLFGQGCLLRLVAYMRENEKCVGCTGRQRVMTSADQDCEDEGLAERFFRLVQTADYEGSYATYTGAFSLIGCLPVLPGPCCMMRYDALTHERQFRPLDPLDDLVEGRRKSLVESDDEMSMCENDIEYEGLSVVLPSGPLPCRPQSESALHHFSQLIATPPDETNLVIENVKLAEDRIPSYAIVTHGGKGSYTTWVDGAIFYFQAETSLEPFVKQRRRWINGALFSYVWLVFMKMHLLLGSSHNAMRRYLIWFMFLVQLFTYGLAIISPSIFASGFYLGLVSLFGSGSAEPAIIASTVIFTLYTWTFIWVHRFRPFVKPLFFFMMVINMIVMILTIAGFIRQASAWGFSPTGIDRIIIQWTIIVVLLVPFFMAAVSLNFRSLWLLVKSCIPYWLFLPTLVGSFTLYSMARLSDTSWGNRVSVAGSNFNSATQHEIAQCQQELSSNSLVALIAFTIINGFVEFFVIYYGVNSWFIMGVLMFVFASTAIQALVSMFYFIGKHLSGLTCWQKWGCCLCCNRRLKYMDKDAVATANDLV